MRTIIIAVVCLMGGCASHQVQCDAHLQPINLPAAKSSPAPAPEAP